MTVLKFWKFYLKFSKNDLLRVKKKNQLNLTNTAQLTNENKLEQTKKIDEQLILKKFLL